MSSTRVAFRVEGMHCGHCAKRVELALTSKPGVTGATVLLAKQQAIVDYDPQQVTLVALMDAVAAQGYAARDAVPAVAV